MVPSCLLNGQFMNSGTNHIYCIAGMSSVVKVVPPQKVKDRTFQQAEGRESFITHTTHLTSIPKNVIYPFLHPHTTCPTHKSLHHSHSTTLPLSSSLILPCRHKASHLQRHDKHNGTRAKPLQYHQRKLDFLLRTQRMPCQRSPQMAPYLPHPPAHARLTSARSGDGAKPATDVHDSCQFEE